jgi:hypothetical protein
MWCIPPKHSAAFVFHMEDVLEVYHRPPDPQRPVVCLDECSKQLIGEVRTPLPPHPAKDDSPGRAERYHCEYVRNGTANLFMAFEPLGGWRAVAVTDQRRREDWARFVRDLVDGRYREADKLVLVMDQLNHPLPGFVLRGIRARGGQASRQSARDPPHAQARLVAEHGRGRAERSRPRPAGPGRRQGDAGASRPGLAASAQRCRYHGRLAVHHQGRPHQAP